MRKIKIKLANRFKNAIDGFKNSEQQKDVDMSSTELLQWLGIDRGSKNLQEITYYTCLKMLSESISKLPIKYYRDTDKGRIRAEPDNSLYVLNQRPNKFMSASTFWSTVELNRNHYGNAYILKRERQKKEGKYTVGSELRDLWILPSQNVRVVVDNCGYFLNKGDIFYKYNDPYDGREYVYKSEDIIHLKSFYTFNGLVGKSVAEVLGGSIEGALESQKYMNNLYKSGMTASMALQYTADLNENLVAQLQAKYEKFLTGSQNAGKVVPVPLGLQLQPLNTKLVDAQFFELKKFGALQIAGAMGIKPNQINNYEKSSYANSETQQLAFLVDTMLWVLKQYEDEVNYKVLGKGKQLEGFFYKWNEKTILRADSKTQIENLARAVNNGIYTPNEARRYLDMDDKDGGDILMANGNFIPLTIVGEQYTKGSDSNE